MRMKRKIFLFVLWIFMLQSMIFGFAAMRDTKPDTWVGGSTNANCFMPTFEEVGAPRANKEVGIYYFLWHAEHEEPTSVAHNLTKISWGMQDYAALHRFHFWDEPFLGYYDMQDPFVIRKHAQMLTDAGVDVIFIDNTNNYLYADTVKNLINVYAQMRAEGNDTPYICSMMHNVLEVNCPIELYETFFAPTVDPELRKKVDDLWYRYNGKYFLLADREQTMNNPETPQIYKTDFEIRTSWTDIYMSAYNWPWCGLNWEKYGYAADSSVIEETYVMTADTALTRTGRSTRRDGSNSGDPGKGSFFADQWEKALSMDPRFVLVTQFNEWMAQRQPDDTFPDGIPFVDMWGRDASRDIEPMYCFDDKGGFGDNFMYYLSYYIRKYKGVREIPTAKTVHTIDIAGDFSAWDAVEAVYLDDVCDTIHRDYAASYVDPFRTEDAYFYKKDGMAFYRNSTGRNDFDTMKVAFDDGYLYFYVKTVDAITPYKEDTTWMQLLLNTDAAYDNGWQGYEYIVNRKVDAHGISLLEKSLGGWQWETIGEVELHIDGNEMMLAIPREFLGYSSVAEKEIKLDFKWIDHTPVGNTGINPMDFIDKGDAAPNDRYNYRLKAVLPTGRKKAMSIPTLYADTKRNADIEAFILDAVQEWLPTASSVQFLSQMQDDFVIGSFTQKLRYHVMDNENMVLGFGIIELSNESQAAHILCNGQGVDFALDHENKTGKIFVPWDTAPWQVIFSENAIGTFRLDDTKIDGETYFDFYRHSAENLLLTYTENEKSVTYTVDIVWEKAPTQENGEAPEIQEFALLSQGKIVSEAVSIHHNTKTVNVTVSENTDLASAEFAVLSNLANTKVNGDTELSTVTLSLGGIDTVYTVEIVKDIVPKLRVQNVSYQEFSTKEDEIIVYVQGADVKNLKLEVLSDGEARLNGQAVEGQSFDLSKEATLVYKEGDKEATYRIKAIRKTVPPSGASFYFEGVKAQKFTVDHQTKTITAHLGEYVPTDSMHLVTYGGTTYIDGKNAIDEWFNFDRKTEYALVYTDGGESLSYTLLMKRQERKAQHAYGVLSTYKGDALPTAFDAWQTVARPDTGTYAVADMNGERALYLAPEHHHVVSTKEETPYRYVLDFDAFNVGEQAHAHFGTMFSLRNRVNNELVTSYSGIWLSILGNQLMLYASDERRVGFADNNQYNKVTMDQSITDDFMTVRVVDTGDKIKICYQMKNGKFADAFEIRNITEKAFIYENYQTGETGIGTSEGIAERGYISFFHHGGLGVGTYLKNFTFRKAGVAEVFNTYYGKALPTASDVWQTVARPDTGAYSISSAAGESALKMEASAHHIVSTKYEVQTPYCWDFDVLNIGAQTQANFGSLVSLRNRTNYDLITTYSGIWMSVLGDKLMLYGSENRGLGFADNMNYSIVNMDVACDVQYVTIRVLDEGNVITVLYKSKTGAFKEAFVIKNIKEKSFAYENIQTGVHGVGSSEGIAPNGYINFFHHGGLGVDTYIKQLVFAKFERPKESSLSHIAVIDPVSGKNAVEEMQADFENDAAIYMSIVPEVPLSQLKISYVATLSNAKLLYHGQPVEDILIDGTNPIALVYTDGEVERVYTLYVSHADAPTAESFKDGNRVKVAMENRLAKGKDNATVFIACYDAGNRLLGVSRKVYTVNDTRSIFDLKMEEDWTEEIASVQILCWDGMEEMTPLTQIEKY